jgi:hypothetical protein
MEMAPAVLCHFLVEHTSIGNMSELELVSKAIMTLGDEAEALVDGTRC